MEVAKSNVTLANETLAQARDRFSAGVADNLEVVQAGKDLADARQEYYSSVMNYNIAQLRLLFQIGQLTPQRVLASLVIN